MRRRVHISSVKTEQQDFWKTKGEETRGELFCVRNPPPSMHNAPLEQAENKSSRARTQTQVWFCSRLFPCVSSDTRAATLENELVPISPVLWTRTAHWNVLWLPRNCRKCFYLLFLGVGGYFIVTPFRLHNYHSPSYDVSAL